jgi:hypothetical protein
VAVGFSSVAIYDMDFVFCKTYDTGMENWTFLTNYGHVFLCIAADPGIRLVDVAAKVGITERSAQRIVADLIEDGYLEHSKIGRRNYYEVRGDLPLRHPVEKENAVGALLKLLGKKKSGKDH